MISEKAVLVDLDIHQWGARVEDKEATKLVINQAGAQYNSGKFYKKLMDRYTSRISQIAGRARAFHNLNTLPWDRSGRSLLPIKNYFNYVEGMKRINADLERVVDEFVQNYEEEIEAEKRRLGNLFNPNDYPTAGEIRRKYKLHYIVEPVPEADFRVGINQEEVERLKAELEERIKEKTEAAVKELFQRLYAVVSKLAERLKEKQKNPSARLHESLLNNVKALCNILPKLNLTDNKELEELVQKVEKEVLAFSSEDIKEDEVVLNQVMKKADEIANKLSEFI